MGDWITELIEQVGYAAITALMFLENLFPPIPSEVIMLRSGFVSGRGQ